MATLDFSIVLLETFELGPTLLQGPEEPKLPEPLCHSPVHLAVPMTVSESLIKLRLTENCEESSGLFMAPSAHLPPSHLQSPGDPGPPSCFSLLDSDRSAGIRLSSV